MTTSRYMLISIIGTIFLFMIFLRFKPRNSSSRCHSLLQTCLKSKDVHKQRRSFFHSSMVHFTPPVALNYWIQNKTGFEIGGPSHFTWGPLGVYEIAEKVDITNFASYPLWGSGVTDGSPFMWKNQPKGKQYIREAVDLHGIPDEFYDFVCASDVLEHIANPFKALIEWIRVLRPRGLLLIIVPLKNATFDHKRDVARIEHLINDYHNEVTEADLSHLNDILRLHDLERDKPAGDIETFKARSKKNFQNRGLHQHVYDQELLYYTYACLNLEVKIQFIWNYHNLIIGQKR